MNDMRVVFTCYHRPEYLTDSLISWQNARGYDEVEKDVFIEPSPKQDLMKSIVEQFGATPHINSERKGVLTNPWVAMDWAFENTDADFVILGEEDLIVSADVLEYFDWARKNYSPEEALGVCCHTSGPGEDDGATFLNDFFEVWVWGTWRENWYNHLRDTWDHDYSTGLPDGSQAGWDWNLARLAKSVKPFVQVETTRAKHIGEHGGTHMTAAMFATIPCPTFVPNRGKSNFYRYDD